MHLSTSTFFFNLGLKCIHARHEITGIITKVGSEVSNFKIGDKVGVGCLAATCLKCEFCNNSQENYCDQVQFTYNGTFWDGSITYGGYSNILVADHRYLITLTKTFKVVLNFSCLNEWIGEWRYVVRVPENLAMDKAAPLLCAGITVYCPMKDNNLFESKGKRVGIIGLGGLGHVAVKFGKALGHHVSVISTSPSKEMEARHHLGADDFILSTNPKQMQVSVSLSLYIYMSLTWMLLTKNGKVMTEIFWSSECLKKWVFL